MTNKLFVTIYGNVGTNVQDTSSAMSTIIKTYCNNAYREILRRVNWQGKNMSYQVSAVGGTQDYVLPSDFGKELYLYDTNNKIYLPFIAIESLAEKYPESLSLTGSVERYTTYQDVVRLQPTSASVLSVSSSSGSDTTQVVRLKGTDANDVEIDESVTLTGTTPVATSGTFKSIRSVSKSATTVGRVTVTSNGAAVTNAVLALADLDYKVMKLRLHWVPNGALTLNFPYLIKPYPLSSDYDTPIIECADGIELLATAAAWRYKRQFAKAQEFERLFEKWVVDAAWDMENQPNQTHQTNPKPYPRDND